MGFTFPEWELRCSDAQGGGLLPRAHTPPHVGGFLFLFQHIIICIFLIQYTSSSFLRLLNEELWPLLTLPL